MKDKEITLREAVIIIEQKIDEGKTNPFVNISVRMALRHLNDYYKASI